MKKNSKGRKKVYKHFQSYERDELAHYLSKGYQQNEIAVILGRHPSTISREISRNGSSIRKTYYRANRAQFRASERKKISHQKVRLKNEKIKNYVINHLKNDYTPEQIAGRISIEMKGHKSNHESIYLFIYNERPDLTKYLVRGKRKRQKRSIKSGKRMHKITNRVMIDKRPKKINSKKELGHWEADTIISRQSKTTLAVVRERKLQVMFIKKIKRRDARSMEQAVFQMLNRIPKRFRKSITFDNGLENANHKRISKALRVKTYFCHPYHSWEKGGIENGIGLIRRYFPKKTDFSLISSTKIRSIELRLNNRPRKSLKFLTPFEAYRNCA